MRKGRRLAAVFSVLVMLVVLASAGAVSAQAGGTKVAGGFNGPQGVLVAPDGNIWVIDSGTGGGDTARVVQVAPDGAQAVAAALPSIQGEEEIVGGARLALLNGTLYVTSGGWTQDSGPNRPSKVAAIVKVAGGATTEVANTWDIEKDTNPGGFVLDTHPYGLAGGPDGKLWVADAGGNDLLKVNPATGEVELVAVFPGIPGPMENPNRGGAMESDPVPTGLVFTPSGEALVSLLPGAPFAPGSSRIVKVTGAGQISDYATGLSTTTDIRFGPDGKLYAVQFGQFTQQGPVPGTGSILRIVPGVVPETVASGLTFPTSIGFSAAGDAYVTVNGVGAPRSGELWLFKGLAPVAAPAQIPEPVTLVLLGSGLAGVGGYLGLRRRRHQAST